MAKKKTSFECTNCGYTAPRWMGKCPQCQSWNSFEERLPQDDAPPEKQHRARIDAPGGTGATQARLLTEIELNETARELTQMPELDRVLGGGMVKGSFVLLGGDPGVGKSTLALQLAAKRSDLKILYCSGEESGGQIRQRADRMGLKAPKLHIYTETDMNQIQRVSDELKPDLLIIDSIQTVFRPEITSMPGTVAQIRECAGLLMRLAKLTG
ncbi:MAG: AAA family ATPase, partial [Cyclonatronaceae bacterium]